MRILKQELFFPDNSIEIYIPYFISTIQAGFPSPADDYLDNSIDLNRELIKNPSATFFVRVSGNSMIKAGIEPGDLLIVDRSLKPNTGDIAVCFIDGEFTLKYINILKDEIHLVPANDQYKTIKVTSENDFIVWGVVKHVIKSYKNGRAG